jgi:superfamily II DNA/RNA helicase
MFFSATFSPNTQDFAYLIIGPPNVFISNSFLVQVNRRINQKFIRIEKFETKIARVEQMILEELNVGQTGMIIFVEQKQEAEKLAKYLVWKLQLKESTIQSLHGYVPFT